VYSSLRGVCDAGQLLAIGKKAGFSYSEISSGVDFSESGVKSELQKFLVSSAKFQPVKEPVVARKVASWVISGKDLEKELSRWGLKNPGGVFSKVEVLGVDLDGKSTFKAPVSSGSYRGTQSSAHPGAHVELSDREPGAPKVNSLHMDYSGGPTFTVTWFLNGDDSQPATTQVFPVGEWDSYYEKKLRWGWLDDSDPAQAGGMYSSRRIQSNGFASVGGLSNFSPGERGVLEAFEGGSISSDELRKKLGSLGWKASDIDYVIQRNGGGFDPAQAGGMYSSRRIHSSARTSRLGFKRPLVSGKGRIASDFQDDFGDVYYDDSYDDPIEPEDGDIVVNESRGISEVGGRWYVKFEDWDQAERDIKEKMRLDGYFPNVWLEDDHGGYTLTSIDSAARRLVKS
jgi:hypothetical protein